MFVYKMNDFLSKTKKYVDILTIFSIFTPLPTLIHLKSAQRLLKKNFSEKSTFFEKTKALCLQSIGKTCGYLRFDNL